MTGSTALALGLVSSSTSDPRSQAVQVDGVARRLKCGAAHLVDRPASRLRKMKHGVLTHARLLHAGCAGNGRSGRPQFHAVFVTLTYAPGHAWRARHISGFLHATRQWHKRKGLIQRVVWVAEMQQRGAVHYHAIFWLPKGLHMPKPDNRGWWPCGDSNIKAARYPVGYVAKYASKGVDGPSFPAGIRIHGAGGLDLEQKREARWWRAPSEAREFFGADADIRPILGGRVCKLSGLFWRSPWRLVVINGLQYMMKAEGNIQ